MQKIPHETLRMGLFIADKYLRHHRQPPRNLIQKFPQKSIRLLRLRCQLNRPQKRPRRLVKTAQPVIRHAQRQMQLRAVLQPPRTGPQNRDGLRKLPLLQQRLRRLKVDRFRARNWHQSRIPHLRRRPPQPLPGFPVKNRQRTQHQRIPHPKRLRLSGRRVRFAALLQFPVSLRQRHPNPPVPRSQLRRPLQSAPRRHQIIPLQRQQPSPKPFFKRAGRSNQ